MDHPHLIRNVAVIGHLHHGKTTFMDMFVKQTHSKVRFSAFGACVAPAPRPRAHVPLSALSGMEP